MIKIQELRIGNMLFVDGTFIKVGKIEENSISWNIAKDTAKFKIWNPFLPISDKRINPIPLTEEILLKFGFDKTANPRELKYDDYSILLLNEIRFVICNYMENPPSVKVSTVHQLQNLFFSLTGKELTFKKD